MFRISELIDKHYNVVNSARYSVETFGINNVSIFYFLLLSKCFYLDGNRTTWLSNYEHFVVDEKNLTQNNPTRRNHIGTILFSRV